MSDFKVEDVVLIYQGTPTFQDGAVGQVIDRDPHDDSYAVADLRDIGKADRDVGIILNRYAKWVKPEDMVKLEFYKPKKEQTSNLRMAVVIGVVTALISLGVYLEYSL